MSIPLYLVIALVTMHADALATAASMKSYNIISSAILSLLWPVSAPLLIVGVYTVLRREQQEKETRP